MSALNSFLAKGRRRKKKGGAKPKPAAAPAPAAAPRCVLLTTSAAPPTSAASSTIIHACIVYDMLPGHAWSVWRLPARSVPNPLVPTRIVQCARLLGTGARGGPGPGPGPSLSPSPGLIVRMGGSEVPEEDFA